MLWGVLQRGVHYVCGLNVPSVLFLLLLIVLAGCSGAKPQLTKPDLDSIEVEVEAVPANGQVARRIIHVLDWHFVSRERFATDTGSDDPAEHEAHTKVVEAVQKEIYEFLKGLEVKEVYIEGVTPQNLPQFAAKLNACRAIKLPSKPSDSATDLLIDEMRHHDMLQLGGTGMLALEKRLTLLPAEEHQAYLNANPVKEGKVMFDPKLNELREDAVIRTLLKGPPIVYLVFGGAHDFRDNIARLARDAEYVRVRVKSYPK